MKKISLVILLLIISVATTFAVGKSPIKFTHPILGFSIIYPGDWVKNYQDDFSKGPNAAHLKKHDYDAMLLKYSTTPLFAAAKYPLSFPGENPVVRVHAQAYAVNQTIQGAVALLQQQMGSLKDFKVITEPIAKTISGKNAIYMKVSYGSTNRDDYPVETIREILILDGGKCFYTVGIAYSINEAPSCKSDIKFIMDSISLAAK